MTSQNPLFNPLATERESIFPRLSPERNEFRNLCKAGYCYIPLVCRLRADCLTPTGAFLAVGNMPGSFLLESVEKGMNMGRYSFIGFDPLLLLKCRGTQGEIAGAGRTRSWSGRDTLDVLSELLQGLKVSPLPESSVFYGGAVGYLGYDYARQLENIPNDNPDLLNLPDAWWMAPRKLIIFDHVTREIDLVVLAPAGEKKSYGRAAGEIEELRAALLQSRPGPPEKRRSPEPAEIKSSFARKDFVRAVQKAGEYIFAGDIFQVVLSQRLSFPYKGDPFAFYRVLRNINPSPYLFYLHCGDHQVIGSSPEMLVRLSGEEAEVRPIAGTRPRNVRGRTEESLLRELLADEKERAEHLMLVDLGRNDLGRVCRYGTVRVEDFMEVERYSHVLHLVSKVKGKLASGMDAFSLLKAVFPAGTLTGAPKIRAMEIIEEIEPCRRGFYGGAVGYLGFDGRMDTCIAIRSAVAAGGMIHLQAGAGIVADSDPDREYQETIYKLQALLSAFTLLERGEEAWL